MTEDADVPRCRYCFEEERENDPLISPCACRGNQLYTHRQCLIKWQRRQGRSVSTCEVCATPWTITLDALDRECWVRSVRTNPRYPAIDAIALDEAAQASCLARMRPGALILQTPARAEQTMNLPRTMPCNAASNTLALFTHMLTMQRAKHWLHGAFLIVSRGSGDATDETDSLVAVNLTRPAKPEKTDAESLAELRPLLDALAPAAPQYILGGPCHTSQPLCLVEIPASATPPQRGDVLTLHMASLEDARESGGTRSCGGSAPGEMVSPAFAADDAAAQAAELTLPTNPLSSAAPVAGGTYDIIIAEPAVAASLVRMHGAGTRVLVVQGCAIWSTAQLLSEGAWPRSERSAACTRHAPCCSRHPCLDLAL